MHCGLSVCVSVCVRAVVCWAQRGVDESLTSGFIRVRNELPSRIFLLTDLGEQWMDGRMPVGMDGGRRKGEK